MSRDTQSSNGRPIVFFKVCEGLCEFLLVPASQDDGGAVPVWSGRTCGGQALFFVPVRVRLLDEEVGLGLGR